MGGTPPAPPDVNESVGNGAKTETSGPTRLYFHNGWEAAPPRAESQGSKASGPVLVMGADEDVLKDARNALAAEQTPVVLVKPGAGYRELGGLTYEFSRGGGDYVAPVATRAAAADARPCRPLVFGADFPVYADEFALIGAWRHSSLYLVHALLARNPHEFRLGTSTSPPLRGAAPHAALARSFKQSCRRTRFSLQDLEISAAPCAQRPSPSRRVARAVSGSA